MTIASSGRNSAADLGFNYCPQCGHSVYPDSTVEKQFGVTVALCPVDRLRFIYIVATGRLEVFKV